MHTPHPTTTTTSNARMSAEALLDALEAWRPAWYAEAACRGRGADLFHPLQYNERAIRAAIAICDECQVRSTCLDYALDHNIRHGIWGGVTPNQRHHIRRSRTPA